MTHPAQDTLLAEIEARSDEIVALTRELIRIPSVNPPGDFYRDCAELIGARLASRGFAVEHLRAEGSPGDSDRYPRWNVIARREGASPGPCVHFNGHIDVVATGEGWTCPPFEGVVKDGRVYGRGACDMKGGIAAFVAGAAQHLADGPPKGSISLLITGDEEGPAVDGTVRVLEWMRANDQIPDFCLVGEPTCPVKLGDMVKIGRRGSLNAKITVHGTQGHVAYPHRADNPVHRLVRAAAALTAAPLDAGNDWFEPSSLQFTSVDVGNPVTNVIPAAARAMLNIRFNNQHSGASLSAWLRAVLAQHTERFNLDISIRGESFLTQPGKLVETLRQAIIDASCVDPKLDTGGGTSDARFIANYCPVAEFGLVGATMHQTDERVPVSELRDLARIYRGILTAFLR